MIKHPREWHVGEWVAAVLSAGVVAAWVFYAVRWVAGLVAR